MEQYSILAIVPAYNEEANINRVVTDLQSNGIDCVVVDDGSSDRTTKVAESAGGKVLVLPYNLGIGGAVQTGLIYARDNNYDIAVQVDGDGQHKPSEIAGLVRPILHGDADIAIGSRFLGRESFRSSTVRRIGIVLFRTIVSLAVGQRVTDNTSGFRAYNKRAIAFLANNYPCDYPEVEAVVLLKRNGFRIQELPVLMEERQGGVSSITPVRSAYYMIKVLFAVLVSVVRTPETRPKKD